MIIGIRKDAWDAGNESQRWAMRLAARVVEIGQPALYAQPDSTEWLVSADWRISLLDVAILGAVAAGLAAYPNWTVPVDGDGRVDRAAARDQIYDFVKDNIVLPKDVAYTHMVDQEVPVREYVEGSYVDEETGETVTYWYWRDTGETQIIQVEEPLGDRFQLTLDAQGAPSWIAAREWIPAGLSAVEVADV